MEELEKFKKDAPVEVRRAITGIYFANKAKDKLIEYANVTDEQNRNSVFLYFTEGATYQGHCLMASDFQEFAQCRILIIKESLILQLSKEMLFITKQFPRQAQITNNGDNAYGVYIEIAQNTQSVQRMLLVPLDRLMGVPERMAQRLFSELKCSGGSQIVEGNIVLKEPWKKIPRDLIPENKNYKQYHPLVDER